MRRRVYIVPKGTEITQEVIDIAKANNCPEIARGIPPAYQKPIAGYPGGITEDMLPLAYEEPEPSKGLSV